MTTITLKDSDVTVLSPDEIAESLENCCYLTINADERRGASRIENGELIVDILRNDATDKRIDGCLKDEVVFDIIELREAFENADLCLWAKDENGKDVLACFD